MHFYTVFWRWGDLCMHFYRVCWIPLMGMSCFLVQNCSRFTQLSCFSVHFCLRSSHISYVVCKFAYICVMLCVCGALGGKQFLRRVGCLHAIFRCFLRAVYGNVMFFTVFADRQVRFDCIFTRFADNRLWEYCIFSFKNACLAQKSRVFPLTFHLFLLPEAL